MYFIKAGNLKPSPPGGEKKFKGRLFRNEMLNSQTLIKAKSCSNPCVVILCITYRSQTKYNQTSCYNFFIRININLIPTHMAFRYPKYTK